MSRRRAPEAPMDRASPALLDAARVEAGLDGPAAPALLQALFAQSPIGVQLVDLRTRRAVASNAALTRITGYTGDELRQVDVLGAGPTDGYRPRPAWYEELEWSGRFGPGETRLRHRLGHELHLSTSGMRVTAADGTPYAWAIVQDITERKSMEQAWRDAAERDRLTGLPNRNVMLQRVEKLLQRSREEPGFQVAILFLDFDRFKLVNDTLGHEAGDELLVAVARRLARELDAGAGDRDGNFAARFGGDEFVIVMAGDVGVEDARALAARLITVLAEPYVIKGHDFQSGASIGIALADAHCRSPDELLRSADIAMYEAKRAGRQRSVVFDRRMHERLERAVTLEAGLRQAIERNELSLVYQPIVDLETGRMTSVEALLRWRHAELGPISPAEFVPIAEESGLIVEIGRWVLREACRQWTTWQRQDPARAPAGMSVNLSRVQVAHGPSLITDVHDALRDSAMPPSALQLEITEREVMKDPAGARDLLLALASFGVRLAMDDFGTGTSSLGCLRDYPFHSIKIDKSFVTDLGRDRHVLAVAHATVNVIENLGMVSVAEGIEEPAELATLQAMGCRYGQGYLFARPVPADELLRLAVAG